MMTGFLIFPSSFWSIFSYSDCLEFFWFSRSTRCLRPTPCSSPPSPSLSKLHNERSLPSAQDFFCVRQRLDVTTARTVQRSVGWWEGSAASLTQKKVHENSWQPSGISCITMAAVSRDRCVKEGISLWEETVHLWRSQEDDVVIKDECKDNRWQWLVWGIVPLWLWGLCQGFPLLQPAALPGENENKDMERVRETHEVNSRLLTRGFPPLLKHLLDTCCKHQRINRPSESWSRTRAPVFVILSQRAIMAVWKHQQWNQKCVSGCSLFTPSSHHVRRGAQTSYI